MIKYPLMVILGLLFSACEHKESSTMISSDAGMAESVFLTHDQDDNPVVVWTERANSRLSLFFARTTDEGNLRSKPTIISLASDVSTHAKGMPKVAFRKDGTIIAAYEKKAPTKGNKYASAIYYITSADDGKSWTQEAFLHSDTATGKSRSYFDIERLPDGEIGASWLDITFDDELRGRSVRFARTSSSNKFGNEVLIDSSACQCCRIDVYTDHSENIFVAYRGLMKGELGKQIRDMMIATSTDHGESFSRPFTVSADNWNIDGCPHTGPSLCSNKAGLISLWYTEGSGTGIYYAQKSVNDSGFSQRELISNDGHHPQVTANGDRIAMLWEVNTNLDDQPKTIIHYRIMADGVEVESDALTSQEANAFLPVVTQAKGGFLVAYLLERENHVGVCLKML